MQRYFTEDLKKKIRDCGVIAVLVIEDADDAVPVAKALIKGGINAMELTLRTPAALDALKNIRREVPEMLAGVGTVIQPEQLNQVQEAGAKLAVAPGTNPRVIEAALEQQFPFAPGIATASDLEIAIERGCRVLKVFPAEHLGGMTYLKSMSGPYSYLGLEFIPLGGINTGNLISYLENPSIMAVGGSWLAKKDVIKAKNWDEIARNAEAAREVKEKVRGA